MPYLLAIVRKLLTVKTLKVYAKFWNILFNCTNVSGYTTYPIHSFIIGKMSQGHSPKGFLHLPMKGQFKFKFVVCQICNL